MFLLFLQKMKESGKACRWHRLEAMSMGIPVIGSQVSGITDILEGFEEYLFEAGK